MSQNYIKPEDVKKIIVHWSESSLINLELGCDDNCDIEKEVDIATFDDLVNRASKEVSAGYDKTSLTVFIEGVVWAKESKFYLSKKTDSAEKLLNS